jgi:hypothetical protein
LCSADVETCKLNVGLSEVDPYTRLLPVGSVSDLNPDPHSMDSCIWIIIASADPDPEEKHQPQKGEKLKSSKILANEFHENNIKFSLPAENFGHILAACGFGAAFVRKAGSVSGQCRSETLPVGTGTRSID